MKYSPSYALTAEIALPDFETEIASVAAERLYVARQIVDCKRAGVMAYIERLIDQTPGIYAWQKYDRLLVTYLRKLNTLQTEIAAGLIPIKIAISNNGDSTGPISVIVNVKGGNLLKSKKTPQRPTPIDGEEASNWLDLLAFRGFWRSGQKITAHRLAVNLSKLDPGECALIIYEAIYVQISGNVTMAFTVQGKHLADPLRGDVLFPGQADIQSLNVKTPE